MHPLVCHLGPVPVYSYGVMLALAVSITAWLVARDARKIGVARETTYDLVFWVVLFGIMGARFFYILLNHEYFLAVPGEAFMLWKGGLAWQGSLIAGSLAAVFYIRKRRIPLWKFLDVAAPYVALGHAIGRIGCLLNGCCYGKPVAWGVYFPVWGERLHPTQIYMSLGQLAIFLVLRALQPHMKRDGQVFAMYLLLTATERFVVEFFRADHELYAGLSIFQYVCLGIFAVALVVNVVLARSGMARK